MDDRRKFLNEVVANFLSAREQWIASDAIYITAALERRVDELIESFAEGDIPGALRSVEHLVRGALAPAWSEWQRDAARTGDERLLPGDTFWKAVEELERATQAATPKPVQRLESIEELKAQKVADAQICLIYGWTDDNGGPEIWRLREELAEPGKHTAGWEPPAVRQERLRVERQEEIRERTARNQRSKVDRLTKPAKESIEELISQNLSARQIADLRKCTVQAVLEAADAAGLKRPPLNYDNPHAARGPYEQELTDDVAKVFDAGQRTKRGQRSEVRGQDDEVDADEALDDETYEAAEQMEELREMGELDEPASVPRDPETLGAMTLEREIVMYAGQGLAPGEIAAAVSKPGMEVSLQRVNGVLRRFKSDPQAFE